MGKERKDRHLSEMGKRLDDAIKKKYGSVVSFAVDLSKELDGTGVETIQATLSKMMATDDQSTWNKKYFLGIERLLDVRIADIIDGAKEFKPYHRAGLYEIGSQGSYKDFEELANDEGNILKEYDEFSNSIFDYVYEFKNLEGFHFLVDNDYFQSVVPGGLFTYYDRDGFELKILELIAEDRERGEKIFIKLFDSFENLGSYLSSFDSHIKEDMLEEILNSDLLMDCICREPIKLKETYLNRVRRNLTNGEYEGICASNWLTPTLCYALEHEDLYKAQALRLLDASLKVADQTLKSLGENKQVLLRENGSATDDSISITTNNGRVILDRYYVIGVIGEPRTKAEIKDRELAEKADQVTAKIGSFRALAKYRTGVKINGKLHLPRVAHNNVYSAFIEKAVGRPYLLQKTDNNGDQANDVFVAPEGERARGGLTDEQWQEVGEALKSIHQIPTEQDWKAYCHGRFYYDCFLFTQDGHLEVIDGYDAVYIGNPEDDVFAAAALAFRDKYDKPTGSQERIKALLRGYGYPLKGFNRKLYAYLTNLATMERDTQRIDYIFYTAAAVARAIAFGEDE